MMMTNPKMHALALGVALMAGAYGCGDNSGNTSTFAKTYEVVVHTRNSDSCDSEGREYDQGDPFFKLTFDGKKLSYHACTAADSCNGSVNTSMSFDTKQNDSWTGRTIDTTQHRNSCDATLTERVATHENGNDLRIETRTYHGTIDHDAGAPCPDQFVLDNRSSLDCNQYDVVVAVPAK